MEALKLAFDTVIVGVLALPWLAFVLDMFFRPKNSDLNHFWSLWSFLKGETGKTGMEISATVASVFLFVAAYFVGVLVTRASGDFFNDEMPSYVPTENNIRTVSYCALAGIVESENGMAQLSKNATEPAAAQPASNGACGTNKEAVQQLFYLRESAVLLAGGEKTDRLNQLHSQILVLRGAAFNGLITLMLCLFGLGGSSRRRLMWWVIPLAAVGAGLGFLVRHAHHLNDPPLMEFTCVVVGLAGGFVLWKGAPRGKYAAGALLSLLAFCIAFLGWWWSELLYDQQVFFSFYALSNTLLPLAK